ncbi:MAG: hypothetical protein QOD25_825, partial [Alphaproteobacteria bacterium]|nr:hypothetical protein [Alphaproteobacteria bacterium]
MAGLGVESPEVARRYRNDDVLGKYPAE